MSSAAVSLRCFLLAVLLPLASCQGVRRQMPPITFHRVDAALADNRAVWDSLPPRGALAPELQTRWRASLHGLLHSMKNHSEPETWSGTRQIDGWSVTFTAGTATGPVISPAGFDDIRAAGPLKSSVAFSEPVKSDGAGLPVVMVEKNSPLRREPFLPLNGRHLPATLTAEFKGPRQVTLTFHNTRTVTKAPVKGTPRPLAADLSDPVATAMSRLYFSRFAIRGLFLPDRFTDDAGIYMPEPYDPAKIPVVFVHGINSDPHIWGNAMNSIAGDPALRQRYQCWYFLYPTGLTIHGAAATLRRSLRQAREHYDQQHRSVAMNNMILVGHSMGGLLSRMQVIDSGSDFYRAYFTVPPAELPLSRRTRELVQETLSFQHLPFVKRVVFIAVPHKGSEVVEWSPLRSIFKLIQPTVVVRSLLKEMTSVARYAINPELQRFKHLGTRSTENLSPHHPLLATIRSRPILVPYHNIIAEFAPMSKKGQSSDGVVPYESAYIEGAVSTSTVKAFHSCTKNPEVCTEITRILRLHARLPAVARKREQVKALE
jgi:hypothetical protein